VSSENFSRGRERKKDRKIAKKNKTSSIKPLPGGNGKKTEKIAKKDRKIALLSLYLLYLYHV